jgi:hypothetical protein
MLIEKTFTNSKDKILEPQTTLTHTTTITRSGAVIFLSLETSIPLFDEYLF